MLLFYLCLVTFAHNTLGENILEDYIRCHRSNPDLSNCLKEHIEFGLKEYKNGIPELNIESFDPFHLDFMAVETDLESLKLNIVMKNITTYGISDVKIKHFKFDPKTLAGEASYFLPNCRMTCTYFSSGRLFVIPLESSAYFDGNFTDSDVFVSFKAKKVLRKNVEYFTIDKLTMKFYINSGHMKLTAINKDTQPQVNVIQDFFNENDRLVMDVTNPMVMEQAAKLFRYVIEKYLRRYPADLLLPE